MDVIEDFLNLILPSKCVLCKNSGSPICQTCIDQHLFGQRQVSRLDLLGLAVCEYDSIIQALIHEYKENGQTQLATAMAKSIARLVPTDCKALVPMPSKKSSFRKRGFMPAKLLGQRVARQVFKDNRQSVQVLDLLNYQREVQDQAALSGHDRRQNLAGAFSLKHNLAVSEVWLFDDVVTTGATLREAKRCLVESGIGVAGFICLAETLPKNQQKRLAESV
jgi:ComF family protein